MYSGYRVNCRISDRAEIRTPNFVLVLGLFLFYFSLLLDLHDAFTTCSMTNTTVTSDLAPLPMIIRKGIKNMKRKPILVPSLVVSTHAIPNILKNVPPLFTSFQQSIKYYYHCSDIRNAYVNDMLPIFISAINGNGKRRLISCLTPIEHR